MYSVIITITAAALYGAGTVFYALPANAVWLVVLPLGALGAVLDQVRKPQVANIATIAGSQVGVLVALALLQWWPAFVSSSLTRPIPLLVAIAVGVLWQVLAGGGKETAKTAATS